MVDIGSGPQAVYVLRRGTGDVRSARGLRTETPTSYCLKGDVEPSRDFGASKTPVLAAACRSLNEFFQRRENKSRPNTGMRWRVAAPFRYLYIPFQWCGGGILIVDRESCVRRGSPYSLSRPALLLY